MAVLSTIDLTGRAADKAVLDELLAMGGPCHVTGGDFSGLEFRHRAAGGVGFCRHCREESVIEIHAADIDGYAEVGVAEEILLEALPESGLRG